MGERDLAHGEALGERRCRQEDRAQQLALLQHVGVHAGDEVDDRHLRAACRSRGHRVQTPSSAAVSEIMAPAGSDMQTLPPTVAAFQILNDIRKRVDALVEQRHGASIPAGP